LDSSIGISTNSKVFNVSAEAGFGSLKVSGSMTRNNTTAIHSFGIDKFNGFYEFGLDTDMGGGITNSIYGRGNINMLIPIIIYVGVNVPIPSFSGEPFPVLIGA